MSSNRYIAVLLLGSNKELQLGDKKLRPKAVLSEAVDRLSSYFGSAIRSSKVLKTKPMGKFVDEGAGGAVACTGAKVQDFYNQVLMIKTPMPPMKVLAVCQKVEKELGRVRSAAALKVGDNKNVPHTYASRSIDIDILQIFKEVSGAAGDSVSVAAVLASTEVCFKEVHRSTPRLQLPHPQIKSRPFVRQLMDQLAI